MNLGTLILGDDSVQRIADGLAKRATTEEHMKPYDIISDVHGHVQGLRTLLFILGCHQAGRANRHPKVCRGNFMGDPINRGPRIGGTLRAVCGLMDLEKHP